MKNSIKTDIRTWFFSRRFLGLFVTLCGIFVFFQLVTLNLFTRKNDFLNLLESKSELQELVNEANLNPDDESNEIVSTRHLAESYLHSINPKHSLTYSMEIGIYVFPLVFSVFSAMTVQADCSNGICRHRISREGKIRYFFGKQSALLLMGLGCVTASVLFAICSSFVLYRIALSQKISAFVDINGKRLTNAGNDLRYVLFFVLCIIVFMEIGFLLGSLSKTVLVPLAVVLIVHYIADAMFPYAPTLCISQITNTLFSGQGAINWSRDNVIYDIRLSWVIIGASVAICELFSFLLFKFRSTYKKRLFA